MNLESLAKAWIESKKTEQDAVSKRRAIEDQILSLIGIDENFTGTQTHGDVFEIKITRRIDTKVDADKVQEIAMENGLSEHLSTLFRWKPEINAKAWKTCDDSIKRPLSLAVTSKPGRPTFSITQKETK